jgi:hypothetical protein
MNEFGVDKFASDLVSLGYEDIEMINDSKNQTFVVIKKFTIEYGRFNNTIIQLGIPVPTDYPRSLMASIHVKSNPILMDYGSSKEKYNIVKSTLGNDWRYWSNRFSINGINPTLHIMAQINGIFRDI